MQTFQVLFYGMSCVEELLFSLFSSMWISREFKLPSLVWICRDRCRVVSWIDPCFKADFTLYFQYKMTLETLSKDGYSEKTIKLYFINRFSSYLHLSYDLRLLGVEGRAHLQHQALVLQYCVFCSSRVTFFFL